MIAATKEMVLVVCSRKWSQGNVENGVGENGVREMWEMELGTLESGKCGKWSQETDNHHNTRNCRMKLMKLSGWVGERESE